MNEFNRGVEAVAKFLENKANSFADEYGRSDPETGTLEFGNEIKDEYWSGLMELVEDIRKLAVPE